MQQTRTLPPVLVIRPWIDPVVEEGGVAPASHYVETYWLPQLGPSCTWLYRRLGSLVTRQPGEHSIESVELARSLGLGTGLGPNAPLVRSLTRLARFGIVQPDSRGLSIRRALAPLSERQLARLPASLQQAHRLLGGS